MQGTMKLAIFVACADIVLSRSKVFDFLHQKISLQRDGVSVSIFLRKPLPGKVG